MRFNPNPEVPSVDLSLRPSDPVVPSSGLPSHLRARYVRRFLERYARKYLDAVALYRPLPGDATGFHLCPAHTRILSGSNQAGKTLTVSIEVARIVLGRHPSLPKRNGRMLCVGKNSDHIGETQWRKLATSGAFDVVPDEITGATRAVRVDPDNPHQIDPIDEDRRELWQPSQPILPAKNLKVAWNHAGRGVPKKVTILSTGWEMLWHSSEGDPVQGTEFDVAWFDEEILKSAWYNETVARLLRRAGHFIWSATPQAATEQLLDLHNMAELDETGDIAEFKLLIDNNPYIPADAKRRFYNTLSEDERDVRYYGNYGIQRRRVYPQFSESIHGCAPRPIPSDWMRIMVLDPGTQVCCALFAALSPDSDKLHVFDEIYTRNADATAFAEQAARAVGDDNYELFIIDGKAGAQTPMGFSMTIEDHYSEELRRRSVSSAETGSGFQHGSNEKSGREGSLKRLLRPNEHGSAVLRLHLDQCPNLRRELPRQFYKKDVANKREDRVPHDAVDCLEMLAAFFDSGLTYVAPRVPAERVQEEPVYAAFKKKQARSKNLRRNRGTISL